MDNFSHRLSSNPSWVIVIPAYNEEERIQKCLQSIKVIIWKSKHAVNIIVVDNGSSDKTREIASAMWVTVIEEDQKGLKYARYSWIQAAKSIFNSRVILQLDADSLVRQGWIEEHLDRYEEDSSIGLVWWSLHWTWKTAWAKALTRLIDIINNRSIFAHELNYFEKRDFWVQKWVIPSPGSNTSYLAELWIDIKPAHWKSSMWEDYIRATQTVKLWTEKGLTYRLIDNARIKVDTPAREDSWFLWTAERWLRHLNFDTIWAIESWVVTWSNDMKNIR